MKTSLNNKNSNNRNNYQCERDETSRETKQKEEQVV